MSTESDQVALLQSKPILGRFGATDRGIPVGKVQEFGRLLQDKDSKEVTIHIHEGAGDGFMKPGGPQVQGRRRDRGLEGDRSLFR